MSRYDLDRDEIAELLADLPRYRAVQLWEGLYRGLADPTELRVLPQALRERLSSTPAFAPALSVEHELVADAGTTLKWLLALADGNTIEAVLMHNPRHSTACVSSQAGCAMACTFCATGDAGFVRQLSTGEIVEQVVLAARAARHAGRRLDHVVFMGMGEPLANFARVWRAIERIIDDLGIAARHVTVSTVGVIPGIRHLAESPRQVNLAVSLHAANNALRDRLVPLNRRYPLHELLAACADYVGATHRRISFEWALIDGVNDTDADADELALVAHEVRAHVNLIPLNPTPGGTAHGLTGSPPARVRAFQGRLGEKAVNATVRRTRGRSIDAACGQLAAVRRDGPRVPPGAGSTASGPPDRPVRGAKADDAPTGPGTDR
ncbi:MAG: 23S rRNA (adenine(2503)-C(2))-methyltransferase RlmN [Acidimicrobiales bacterium]